MIMWGLITISGVNSTEVKSAHSSRVYETEFCLPDIQKTRTMFKRSFKSHKNIHGKLPLHIRWQLE